jgi:hypothetical protein
MNEEPNPYAPPRVEVAVPVASAGTGHGWRIENNKLLVRDGAVLPEICILGGDPLLPLDRSWLRLDTVPGFPSRREIRIETFESRHTYVKRCLGLFVSVVLGFAGGVASSILLFSDDSGPTLANISVPCFVIGVGVLVGFKQCRYLPRLIKGRDGWYRVESIAPRVLARLKEVGGGSSPLL